MSKQHFHWLMECWAHVRDTSFSIEAPFCLKCSQPVEAKWKAEMQDFSMTDLQSHAPPERWQSEQHSVNCSLHSDMLDQPQQCYSPIYVTQQRWQVLAQDCTLGQNLFLITLSVFQAQNSARCGSYTERLFVESVSE